MTQILNPKPRKSTNGFCPMTPKKRLGFLGLSLVTLLAFWCPAQLFGQMGYIDLTARYNLPPVDVDPVGYYLVVPSTPSFATVQAFYLSGGKIFYIIQPLHINLATVVIDIIAQTNATPAKGYLHAYLGNSNLQEVVYIDKYYHVIRIYKPISDYSWRKMDLTNATNGPLAGEGIFGYVSSNDNVNRIIYRDLRNGHINMISYNGVRWTNTNLTALTQARVPAAGYKLCAYSWGFLHTEHIVYEGTNNHIYHIYLRNGRWYYADLYLGSGSPILAAGAPFGFGSDVVSSQYVYYPAADGHIHELIGNFDKAFFWFDTDVTSYSDYPDMTVSPLKQLCAFSCGSGWAQRVVFSDAQTKDMYMYTFYHNTLYWFFEDLTGLPQGRSSQYGTYPGGFTDNYQESEAKYFFLYKGSNNHGYCVMASQ